MIMGKKNNGIRGVQTPAQAIILSDKSPFMMQEGYKALRTNVAFSLPGTEGKCIGVTSGNRGDGKSTNSANVAISFAEVGKKTIILDCDMRLPTVHEKFAVRSTPGLSDLLVGEAKPSDVLVPARDNLDVIPAGRIPKDPTGLLSSKMMVSLIDKLRTLYDYVILDLPPVTTVTDAAILSPVVDGYLLVVRHMNTEYREVSEALRLLRMSEGKVLGFIYNDAPVAQKKYYSNYYYK